MFDVCFEDRNAQSHSSELGEQPLKKILEEYKESLNKKVSKQVEESDPLDDILKSFEKPKRKTKKKEADIELNLKGVGHPKKDLNKILAKSVITPDFEQLRSVPSIDLSEKRLKAMRQREREKTKGKKWFDLPATEVTEEISNDLKVLQMRSVLDPKHFYKKNDLKVLPKYFQVGKVMDSPLEYYNNRLTKKERKKTLVDELLADHDFCKYNKRKYKEILDEKQKTHYKAYRQAKKLKRKNK